MSTASLQLARGGGRDRISALGDDLLLMILGRLGGCVSAAARTSVLARRWRGLWKGLAAVAFRGVALGSLEAALGARTADGASLLRSLDIRVPVGRPRPRPPRGCRLQRDAPAVHSLLCTAVAPLTLSLEELVLTLPPELETGDMDLDLTGSPSLTSIELDSLWFRIHAPPAGAEPSPYQICSAAASSSFAALTTLTLTVGTVDLPALLRRCPRLRVLRLDTFFGEDLDYTVHSATLQELAVTSSRASTKRVDIAAPLLEQLAMSFRSDLVELSVSAPLMEKVSWRCRYSTSTVGFGRWVLTELSCTPTMPGRLNLHVTDWGDHPDWSPKIGQEVEKHLQVVCGGDQRSLDLELLVQTDGHVFGALVVHLLAANRISIAIQRLKVLILQPFEIHGGSGKEHKCQENCRCEPMANWRSELISLPHLEQVEIEELEGVEYHELDFMELLLRSSPMLTTMVVRMSDAASPARHWSRKILGIFRSYPHVECRIHGLDFFDEINAFCRTQGLDFDDDIVGSGIDKFVDNGNKKLLKTSSQVAVADSVGAVMDMVAEWPVQQ